MANICTGQQQILIILTWIVGGITKVLKKAITFLGASTYIGHLWTLTKIQKLFFCLDVTWNQQQIST